MSTHLAEAAANNNVARCAAMWRAHGLPVEYRHGLAFCQVETPRFYPNAVSIDAKSTVVDQVALIETLSRGAAFEFSVKDSFSCLPLEQLGFDLLFDAVWLWRDPIDELPASPALLWRKIDVDRLPEWEAAWRGKEDSAARTFPDALLEDCHVSVIAGFDAAMRIVAGLVAYESCGVVGLTNIFGRAFPPAGAIAAMNDVPLVGYEHGQALVNARRRGFSEVGPLKVWSQTHKQ